MSEERNKEKEIEKEIRQKARAELEEVEKEIEDIDEVTEKQKKWIIGFTVGTFAILVIIPIILLLVGITSHNRTTQGIAFISLLPIALILIIGIVIPKHPERCIIEFMGKYYDTWKSEYYPHFLIPAIMRVKTRDPFMSTIKIVNYMDGKKHRKENGEEGEDKKLDFTDDSAGMKIESTIRIFDQKKSTYGVTIPGGWKALVQSIVDSIIRALAGQTELDAALAGKTELDKELTEGEKKAIKEDYIKSTFSKAVEKIADVALLPYGIDYQAVLMTDIELHDDTIKARRGIQTSKKEVEAEKYKLQTAKLKGIGKGLEESMAITEFIKAVKEGTKEKIELTPEQVMTYIIQGKIPDAFTKGNATLIATRGGVEELLADATAIAGTTMERLKKKGSE